jgi:hypothetical protein
MGEENLDGVDLEEMTENEEDKEFYDYLEQKHEEIGYEAMEKFCQDFCAKIHEVYNKARC